VDAGVDTVVNIGAGLDTRPYRLELPQDLQWIEIDFPHMVDIRNAKLSQAVPRCRLTRFGVDIADRSAARAVYERIGAQAQNVLIITEGVVVYLSNEEAGRLAED